MIKPRDNHTKEFWIALRILGVFVSIVMAGAVTLILMLIQESLIHSDRSILEESPAFNLTDIVRIRKDVDVAIKKRKKAPPPLPDEMPEIKSNMNFDMSINDSEWSMSNVDPSLGQNIGINTGFSQSDGEYLPLVKVAAAYPRRALTRGLSGWVIVEFTVTKSGMVTDTFVISNCAIPQQGPKAPLCEDRPNSIFDRSAVTAAGKFRYKPKVISGEAIATGGVQNKIYFSIES